MTDRVNYYHFYYKDFGVWIEKQKNGGVEYEDYLGSSDNYITINETTKTVEIGWDDSNAYRLHIKDYIRNKYYCIEDSLIYYGIHYFIHPSLPSNCAIYYHSLDTLSFSYYSASRSDQEKSIVDPLKDPNNPSYITIYRIYNNFSNQQNFVMAEGFFSKFKAFKIPSSIGNSCYISCSEQYTRYADSNKYRTLEFRWRFTNFDKDSNWNFIIDTHSTIGLIEYFLMMDENNRYYIQTRYFSSNIYNSILLPTDFNPTQWHTMAIQGSEDGDKSKLCQIFIDGNIVMNTELYGATFVSLDINFGMYGISLTNEPIYDEVTLYDGLIYNVSGYTPNNNYPLIDPQYTNTPLQVGFTSDKYKARPKQQYTLSYVSEVYDIVESSLYENNELIEHIDMKNVDIDDPVNRCVLKITPNGCYTVFRLDFKDDDYSSIVNKRNTSYPQIKKVNNTNYFYFAQYSTNGRGLQIVASTYPQQHRIVNVTMRVKIPDSSNYLYPILGEQNRWFFSFEKESTESRLWFSVKGNNSSNWHYYSSKIFFDEEVFYDLRFVIHASCDTGRTSWLEGVDIYVNNELIRLYDSNNNDHYTENHTSFYSSSGAYLSFNINDYSDGNSYQRLDFEYVYAFDSKDIPRSSYRTRNWVFEKEQPNQYNYRLITVDNHNQSNTQSLTVNVVDGMIFYSAKQYPSVGESYQLILSDPIGDPLNNYVIKERGVVVFSGTTRNTSVTFNVNSTESRTYLYVATVTNDYGNTYTLECTVNVVPSNIIDLFLRLCPNFGATKSLEYKTQIFTSYNHNEERIPLRQCPRITFEYEYVLSNHESFIGFNNSFNESGLTSMYAVPSWIDAIQVNDTSENITLPTENNFSNGKDVLVFKSFSEYKVVSCTITDGSMALNGLDDIYIDCIVVPIFNCYLVDAPKLKQQDYKHSVSVKFIMAQNIYNGFKNYNTTYLGHDLLADFYVTSRDLTTDVDQDVIITDYDIGLRSLYTLNDRTYNGISFNIQCLMSEYPVLQNFIKRRFGKVNPFFIPKETGDLIKKGNGIISTNLNVGMNNFDFDKRPYLFIRLKNGNYLCRKVVSTSADKETLVLDSALNVKYDDITSINTLLFVRLDSDKITYKSVGYGMYSVDLSCVEINFEEYSTITDYDIQP